MEDYNRGLAQAPAAVPSFVPVLQRLWGSGFGHLVEAPRAKAWGTLRRHLFGFKLWLGFHPWQRHCDGRGEVCTVGKLLVVHSAPAPRSLL